MNDVEVELELGGVAHLRAIDARGPSSGATFFLLAGLGASACSSPMFAPLGEALAAAGHQVLAVDWRGDPAVHTIACDVEAVLAVQEGLVAAGLLDPKRVVLFGHSVGALVAALAASVSAPAGLVVYGAAALRFADALEMGATRQLPLRGFAPEAAERESRLAGSFYRAVLREGRAREALSPEILASTAAADLRDDTLFGEPLTYLRSIDAVDPGAVFRRVPCRITAIQGEYDWVVGADDADTIASWAGEGRAARVPGADHYLGEHPDLATSMKERGRGKPSQAARAAVVASGEVLLNHDGVTP